MLVLQSNVSACLNECVNSVEIHVLPSIVDLKMFHIENLGTVYDIWLNQAVLKN